MPSPLMFHIFCPICGAAHLLASQGVPGLMEDPPTLSMVTRQEVEFDDAGDIVAMSELHVTCSYCAGIFEINVECEEVARVKPKPPRLTLVTDS